MQPSISIGLISKCVCIPESHVTYTQDESMLHVMQHFSTARVERHESCRSKSRGAIVAYSYHLVT